jgi:hypothetical protein
MNNFNKIKAMSIDEMAEHLTYLQLNVMMQIQKNLVHCLPLPNEEQQEQLYKDTIKALESEEE